MGLRFFYGPPILEQSPYFERNWSVGTSTEVVKPIEGPRALQIAITSFPIAAKKYGLEFYKFEYLKDGVRFSSGCYIPMVEVM
ncbi:hypothetical protein GCK72_025702 [Caenorhabditis remanei]|uniref:Uncharacterized protein n=1 Tax=Caenorhabditis remanei TaxID=31234 RepID=A0A6A5G3D7_CAERE|nr:hypothetical protein GCK72_025702 [Caenorhabditis remanei]KAF1749235.1 hypothetical protein GCK72_025702 [Caenorhabditis remanei]